MRLGAKAWEKLRRPDWLQELQAVLVTGLVVAVALGARGFVTMVGGDSLRVELPASAVSAAVDGGLRQGAAVTSGQDVAVTVTDPSLDQRAALALTVLPTYTVIVALLVLLLRIVWYARRSDPFTLATVRRLRVLAVVALAGGWLGFIVEAIAELHLSNTVLAGGAVTTLGLSFYWWFLVGFGLFAVAEVVKRGCAMRAELESVV